MTKEFMTKEFALKFADEQLEIFGDSVMGEFIRLAKYVLKEQMVSSELQAVLDDYHTCCSKLCCDKCKAHHSITSDTTWCEFLRNHGAYVTNEMLKTMGKTL